ncbi:sugar-binding protein [Streptomyces sp. LP05-1]|uniref:Sugar-binding protein n=1 Tax=Streptomyces pyxinae TaxID=2970734 RepID=A0ABT2CHB1_9ACTN|nr:sugar-binding protein [Streptomyces sp. LP05-1]MCS0636800.1 sugar-binding protein [Streptomyces sp. LP05-1]
MARPGDWSALGLGGDPTPGDASVINGIADAMRDLASSAATVNTGLRELQNTAGDGQRFIGKTADALRDQVDDHLHKFVGRVEESFHIAEGALRTYATAVTNAQAEADQALSSIQGLSDDDPGRETMKQRASDAKSDLETAATNLRSSLSHAGSLMVQPVSDCDLFWEAFQWLTIIISVIAVFTGGILGIIAWGMNAALLIKTIVDFSQGKASGLELGLAFLGVLFPSTKGINVGQLIKGLGNTLKTGIGSLSAGGKALSLQAGNIARLTGLPKIVIVPVVAGAKVGASFRSGFDDLVRLVGDDWARVTGNVTGTWGKVGAYGLVTIERMGRFTVAALVPLNATEIGVLGFGGAARLAFGERVLGIPHPQLHELLVNAGRTDSILRGGSPATHITPGTLVPVPRVSPAGVHFAPGFTAGVPPLTAFRPGTAGFGGLTDLFHLSMTRLPTVDLGALGFGGLRALPAPGAGLGPGAHLVPGAIGAVPPVGQVSLPPGVMGAVPPVGQVSLPPGMVGAVPPVSQVSLPPGMVGAVPPVGQMHLPPGTVGLTANPVSVPGLTHFGGLTPAPALVTPPVPHGMTVGAGGLTLPATHGLGTSGPGTHGAVDLLHQTDLAAGQVRLDSNLLLPGHTAVDLLSDARGAGPVGHLAPDVDLGLHTGTAHTAHVPAVGMGDGVALARGAVGYAEDLNDLTIGELHALAVGDVAVTGIRADGISLRIGDTPARTIDAHTVAATAPVGPAPVSHLPGTGAAAHAPGTGAVTHVPGGVPETGALQVPGTGSAGLPGSKALHVPEAGPGSAGVGTGALHVPETGAVQLPVPGTGHVPSVAPHPPAAASGPTPAPAVPGAGQAVTKAPVPGGTHGVPAPGRSGVPVPERPGAAAPGTGDRAVTPAPAAATPAPPALSPKELALGLLRGDNPPAPVPAGQSARAGDVSGVSARPALDSSGGGHGAAAHDALDLVARPGRAADTGTTLPPLNVSRLEPSAPVPVPGKAGEPVPVPAAGKAEEPVPVPAEPRPDKGKGRAAPPPPDTSGIGRWQGWGATDNMNRRIRATHQIIIGGSSGHEAIARLNGWASYQRALTDLGRAEHRLDELTPPPGTGSSSGPTVAHLAAMEDVAKANLVVDKAEFLLRDLGMANPAAVHQEVLTVTAKVHQGGLLGGSPLPRRVQLPDGNTPHPAVPHADTPPVNPADDLADDAMDIEPSPGAHGADNALGLDGTGNAAHVPVPHQPVPHPGAGHPPAGRPADTGGGMEIDLPARPTGGTHLWNPAGRNGGLSLVNDAFHQDLPRGAAPAGPLDEAGYLDFVTDSVTNSRPLGFVVNTIVHYDGLTGLQRFLDSVTQGLQGFDGRIAVVVGVNGPPGSLAAIESAMRAQLASVRFEHPLALVQVPVTPKKNFPYGTVRNATLESAPSTHAVRSMMENGQHPYVSIMDFDAYPHLTPDGRHVFQYFDDTLRMPDEAAIRAAGETPPPPVRPLMMAGGYRAPDLTDPAALRGLIDDTNARLAKDHTGAGAPPAVTEAELPGLLNRIDQDMHARTRLTGIHQQLPYAPEPNLFVDGAAVLFGQGKKLDVRFGPGGAEFGQLSNRLNQLNAWELDRRLPLPGGGTPQQLHQSLRQAADALRGGAPIAARDLPVVRNAFRGLVDALDGPHPVLPGFTAADLAQLRGLADAFGHRAVPDLAGGGPDLARLLGRLDDALDFRLTERQIAARNSVLPDRGTAFVNDVEGAAVPTDLSRLLAGAKKGPLPQDHSDSIKNAVDRLVGDAGKGNVQTNRKGVFAERVRDEWTGWRTAGPYDAANGINRTDDPLWPVIHPPGAAGQVPQRLAGDVSATLDTRLGTSANPLGLGVSAPVPGGDALRAGVPADELRLALHNLTLSSDKLSLLRQLRMFRDVQLAPGAARYTPPPGSLFGALQDAARTDAALDPNTILRNVIDRLDTRPPGSKPLDADEVKKLYPGIRDGLDTRFGPVLDRLTQHGWSTDDFFARLTQGQIHPPSGTLQEFRAGGERFGMDGGSLLVLERYADALGRDIRVTGADGVTQTVHGAPGLGAKRGRDELPPLDITWQPGHGWRVGPPSPETAPPPHGGPGSGGAGDPFGGADDRGPVKRPRQDDAGGPGPGGGSWSSGGEPRPSGSPVDTHMADDWHHGPALNDGDWQRAVDDARQREASARADVRRAENYLSLLVEHDRGGSSSTSGMGDHLHQADAELREARQALADAQDDLQALGVAGDLSRLDIHDSQSFTDTPPGGST